MEDIKKLIIGKRVHLIGTFSVSNSEEKIREITIEVVPEYKNNVQYDVTYEDMQKTAMLFARDGFCDINFEFQYEYRGIVVFKIIEDHY